MTQAVSQLYHRLIIITSYLISMCAHHGTYITVSYRHRRGGHTYITWHKVYVVNWCHLRADRISWCRTSVESDCKQSIYFCAGSPKTIWRPPFDYAVLTPWPHSGMASLQKKNKNEIQLYMEKMISLSTTSAASITRFVPFSKRKDSVPQRSSKSYETAVVCMTHC